MADYTIDASGNISGGGTFGHPVAVTFLNSGTSGVSVTVLNADGNPVGPGEGPFGGPLSTIPPGESTHITEHGGPGVFTLSAGTTTALLRGPCFSIRTDGTTFNPAWDEAVQDERVSAVLNIFNEGAAQVTVYVYDWGTKKLTDRLFGWEQNDIPALSLLSDLRILNAGEYGLTTKWPLFGGQGPKDGKLNVGGNK